MKSVLTDLLSNALRHYFPTHLDVHLNSTLVGLNNRPIVTYPIVNVRIVLNYLLNIFVMQSLFLTLIV